MIAYTSMLRISLAQPANESSSASFDSSGDGDHLKDHVAVLHGDEMSKEMSEISLDKGFLPTATAEVKESELADTREAEEETAITPTQERIEDPVLSLPSVPTTLPDDGIGNPPTSTKPPAPPPPPAIRMMSSSIATALAPPPPPPVPSLCVYLPPDPMPNADAAETAVPVVES